MFCKIKPGILRIINLQSVPCVQDPNAPRTVGSPKKLGDIRSSFASSLPISPRHILLHPGSPTSPTVSNSLAGTAAAVQQSPGARHQAAHLLHSQHPQLHAADSAANGADSAANGAGNGAANGAALRQPPQISELLTALCMQPQPAVYVNHLLQCLTQLWIRWLWHAGKCASIRLATCSLFSATTQLCLHKSSAYI